MARALKVCPTAGCTELTTGGRCPSCTARADRLRGTASDRGYTSRGHKRFRVVVLRRDPICKVCDLEPSTVADHYPLSRKQLLAAGLDPNDPLRGRGLCKRCHDSETARLQPGGWNLRDS
jgi:5-methylcytosine-specific restriction protein A